MKHIVDIEKMYVRWALLYKGNAVDFIKKAKAKYKIKIGKRLA